MPHAVVGAVRSLVVAIAGLVATEVSAQDYSAQIARGLTWLTAQVQSDGRLRDEDSSAALPLQARSESALTLRQLASVPGALTDQISAPPASATEHLARQVVSLSGTGRDTGQSVNELLARQNGDGGFGGEGGHQSSALDTAWALRALWPQRSQEAARAVAWLAPLQTSAGSWEVAPYSPVWTTAVVLRALRDPAATNVQASDAAVRAFAYLLSRQGTDGSWSGSVPVTAAVLDASYDFSSTEPSIAQARAWLAAQQGDDGSWQADPYVTALALRALATSGQAPRNPTVGAVKLRIVDSQTAAALQGALVSLAGPSTAQALSDADGQVLLSSLPPGSYGATLTLASYNNVAITFAVNADQTTDLGSLTLTRVSIASAPADDPARTTAKVFGTIKDAATAQPLADVAVSVVGLSASAVSDATGRYLISNLAPGSYTVTATKSGFAVASAALTAQAGVDYNFSPLLATSVAQQPGDCRLAGRITRAADGQVLAGATIELAGANVRTATSDGNGLYTIASLVSGSTTFRVTATGYDSVSASYNVGCVSGLTIDFSPKLFAANSSPPAANTASVAFTLVNASTDAPLAGITVRATPSGAVARTLSTDANGRVRIDALTQAAVLVEVALNGFDPVAASFQVEPLADKDLGQLRLRPTTIRQLLPDLRVMHVSRAAARTDQQTLALTGQVTVEIRNVGAAELAASAALTAFLDVNRNGRFDAATDVVLGTSQIPAPLAVGASRTLDIPVAGQLPFRDAPIHVWVDSDQQIAESDESNNVRSTAEAALVQPPIGTLSPTLKWHWSGSSILPQYNQVMMAPVVGPTHDTNGDGKIDGNDTPSVIFTAFAGGGYRNGGIMRILDARTGTERCAVANLSYLLDSAAGLALADIDGDGSPEIVGVAQGLGLIAFNPDCTVKWTAANPGYSRLVDFGAFPAIADLDGDGKAEVLYGRHTFDHSGRLLWSANVTFPSVYWVTPVVADINLNNEPVVLIGAAALSRTGQVLWENTTIGAGWTAVGNFNSDPYPEIVVVSGGRVSLLNRNGNLIWGPVAIPGGGNGPPTIADVDGDGVPEIGVAGASRYVVFRADGSILWTAPTHDFSSAITGSTVFDFDGDGKAEVVYADEQYLRIYEGATGRVIWQLGNSSATLVEYPIVADLDGDNHADLLVVSNSFGCGFIFAPVCVTGIRAFQDAGNTWVNTRRIWNQYSYSIDNINDDASVPRLPTRSWETHNTFRLNKRLDVSPTAVADATASYIRVQDRGGTAVSTVTVRVGNGGALSIPPAMNVAAYRGSVGAANLLGVIPTSRPLAAGEYEDLQFSVAGSLAGLSRIVIVADDDGAGHSAVTDFDRGNNTAGLDLAALPGSFVIGLTTDKPIYSEADIAQLIATVSNSGSFAGTVTVRFSVQAADGSGTVVVLAPVATTVAALSSIAVTAPWPVAGPLAGPYIARAELVDAAGMPYAAAEAPLQIVSSAASTLGGTLSTDKLHYAGTDIVLVTDRIRNVTANTVAEGFKAVTTVTRPDGSLLFTASAPLPQMLANASRDLVYPLALNGAPAGVYSAKLWVQDAQAQVVAHSAVTFEVIDSGVTGVGIAGQISATPKEIPEGEVVSLVYGLTNNGNSALTALPLKVRVIDPAQAQVLHEFTGNASAAVGASYSASGQWASQGPAARDLVAALYAVVGGTERLLAQDSFRVIGLPTRYRATLDLAPQAPKLLVLVSCPDANGQEQFGCAASHAEAMQNLFTQAGVTAKVVTDAATFITELRCSPPNMIWISGGADKLDALGRAEVREAVRSGATLLLDGLWTAANTALAPLTGLTYLGSGAAQSGVQGATDLLGNASTAISGGTGRYALAALSSASVIARFLGTDEPALYLNRFGWGKVVTAGFDTVASVAGGTAGIGDFVTALLRATAPDGQSRAFVNDRIGLRTRINNEGSAATIEARLQIAEGLTLLDTDPAAALDAQRRLVYTLALAAATNSSDLLTGVTSAAATTYTVPAAFEVVKVDGGRILPQTDQQSLTFEAPAALLAGLADRINALPAADAAQSSARASAASWVASANSAYGTGKFTAAYDNLLAAANVLHGQSNVESWEPVRIDAARLLRWLGGLTCTQTLSCSATASRVDPFKFTPNAELERLEFLIGELGTARQEIILGVHPVQAAATADWDWLNGQTLAWTLNVYTDGTAQMGLANGSTVVATVQYLGAGGPYRLGNALQLWAKVDRAAGDAAVHLMLDQLNGQNVGDSLTGNGTVDNPVRSTWFIPIVSQGVTAKGRIRFSWPAARPQGASLNATVTLGQVQCQ